MTTDKYFDYKYMYNLIADPVAGAYEGMIKGCRVNSDFK